MHHIDNATIASVLRMGDLIPVMRQVMIDFSRGNVSQPARRILDVESHGGYFGNMTAIGVDAMGAKLVSIYPGNAAKNLDTHMALIALFDTATGEPLATMDGSLITEMRTAAVSAAFVDVVAAPDVSSIAVFGAGAQAHSHLQALSCVRNFTDVRICNRSVGKAERLAAKFDARVTGAEDAVRGADVVVAATASPEPVFDGRWLRPGATVVSVGWAGADHGELDAATMAGTVIVDSREGASIESGNVRRWQANIHAELGELLDGTASVEPGATVVFESIGMASQDIAAGSLVLRRLAQKGAT